MNLFRYTASFFIYSILLTACEGTARQKEQRTSGQNDGWEISTPEREGFDAEQDDSLWGDATPPSVPPYSRREATHGPFIDVGYTIKETELGQVSLCGCFPACPELSRRIGGD